MKIKYLDNMQYPCSEEANSATIKEFALFMKIVSDEDALKVLDYLWKGSKHSDFISIISQFNSLCRQ